jgi:hypothetical protein
MAELLGLPGWMNLVWVACFLLLSLLVIVGPETGEKWLTYSSAGFTAGGVVHAECVVFTALEVGQADRRFLSRDECVDRRVRGHGLRQALSARLHRRVATTLSISAIRCGCSPRDSCANCFGSAKPIMGGSTDDFRPRGPEKGRFFLFLLPCSFNSVYC